MLSLVYDNLLEKGLIPADIKQYATDSLKIVNEREIVVSGNRLGLIELADYIVNVALSDVDFYHLHLDERNFFEDTNLELIIVKEPETPNEQDAT